MLFKKIVALSDFITYRLIISLRSSADAERRVDSAGIEPATLPCHGSVLPVYHEPLIITLTLYFLRRVEDS